jgi:RNA polymerase sigma-70 factor (ECF subfamily)
MNMSSSLSQNEIVRPLLRARARLSAGFFLVLRDVHLAEDVFQEVMVKALDEGELFTNEAHLLSWARAVGRNAGLNLLRKSGRVSVGLPESLLNTLEQESEAEGSSAREAALRDCLDGLPAQSRELLELRYFHGLSCAEVAARAGPARDVIYQRLSRLHRVLRSCVESRLAKA